MVARRAGASGGNDVETTWSRIQIQRLMALDADPAELTARFGDPVQRDRAFQKLEGTLVKQRKRELEAVRAVHGRPGLCRLESTLVETLVRAGFVQVITPTILSRGLLARMGVTEAHDLFTQIFWLDPDRCLRPMLAPHLYYVVKDLLRLWDRPVGIFEIGSCFRKESQGARHCMEFTMLNLCEFGLPQEDRSRRIRELADLVTHAAGIEECRLAEEHSTVYGKTLDVVGGDGLELGSCAMGPHPLDHAWRITDPWVGLGFGLERLLMAARGASSIGRFGRSLAYLDGIPLSL
jgi:phenylalanyl-tRNA synthetase alpha chain